MTCTFSSLSLSLSLFLSLSQCIKLESSLHDEVTMNLSDSLRELLEDGWEGLSKTTPTFCIPPLKGGGVKLQGDTKDCLAWRTLIHYYNLKVIILLMLFIFVFL